MCKYVRGRLRMDIQFVFRRACSLRLFALPLTNFILTVNAQ
jgi:hypothetical protein